VVINFVALTSVRSLITSFYVVTLSNLCNILSFVDDIFFIIFIIIVFRVRQATL